MGIATIGVYSDSDAGAAHLAHVDDAAPLGPGAPAETYLSIDRLLAAARASRANAVHPGYGFLSENADFARAVEGAGLLWIGAPAGAIEAMGGKLASRALMEAAGVPVVPGSPRGASDRALLDEARRIGFPVLVKASAGGGGKGMSRVDRPEDLPAALEEAKRLAEAAFADGTVYLERLLEGARHVEIQVFGDRFGGAAHLFERECSVQRRHQKIVEETPSPALDAALRAAMGAGGGVGREGRRLRGRRYRGIPARRVATLLLSRDEHAAPGGAPDHGGDDGARPRPRADRDRRRRRDPRSVD
jgi:3-methylcrotonyl-CoA carboxylase alpha subunit